MAEKGGQKEPTPPPLLLMPAGEGLTLNPPQGAGLFMPVIQSEASLMAPEEDGEVDSFLGQAPASQGTPVSYFQQPTSSAGTSDPFAQVRQPDPNEKPQVPPNSFIGTPVRPPAPMNIPPAPTVTPQRMPPTMMSAPTPPRGATPNMFRMAGPMRYAQPPPGHYAHLGGDQSAGNLPPISSSTTLPPMSAPGGMPPISTPSHPPSSHLPPMGGQGMPPPMGGQGLPPPISSFAPPPSAAAPPQAFSPAPSVAPLQTSGESFYTPVQHHWFYCRHIELRQVWLPFSYKDSKKLEEALKSDHQDNVVISTDGGRYDVDVVERTRVAVYWDEAPSQVKRCSWFHKSDSESRFTPYDEEIAEKLEEEYKNAIINNVWHKRIECPTGETFVIHNPSVIVQFKAASPPDEWGNVQGEQRRPEVVKRGIDEVAPIEPGEPDKVDHIVYVVHGIGPTCDLRFRNIVECVDDFRTISLNLMRSHFKQYQDEGRVGRVEFLPIRWHAALRDHASGVDRKLKAISLPSIPRLRSFTNDTLLDILFYASPAYCQKIADVVITEINRLHQLFTSRNPSFHGHVSVAGHSLGSLILFDLLAHQRDPDSSEPVEETPVQSNGSTPEQAAVDTSVNQEDLSQNGKEDEEEEDLSLEQLLQKLSLTDYLETFQKEQIDMETLIMCEESDIKEMGLPMGPRKKLQGFLKEQKSKQERKMKAAEIQAQQEAKRQAQEAAEAMAGIQAQQEMQLAVASHPLLRSASQTSIDFLTGEIGTGLPFVKYPQLQFKPANFFALGSPIAMFLTVRGIEMLGETFRLPTCQGFFNIFHPFDPVAYRLEPLVTQMVPPKPVLMPHHKGRKRLHLEIKDSLSRYGADLKQKIMASLKSTWSTISEFARAHRSTPEEMVQQEVDSAISQLAEKEEEDKIETESVMSSMVEEEVNVGSLNQGRRVDFVLQEAPFESFNEYLFALSSHACYWESEDTVLLMLKEIYATMGIAPIKPGHHQMVPMMQVQKGGPPGHQSGQIQAPPLVSQSPPPSAMMSHPDVYRSPPTQSPVIVGHHSGPPQHYSGPPPSQPGPPVGNVGPPPLGGFVRNK